MIIDTLDSLSKYRSLHRLIPAAAEFLAQPGLMDLPDGRHEIQGNALFALVMRAYGKHMDEARLEIHNEYIDIQALIEGTESIGWKMRSTCVLPVSAYEPEKDIQFFDDAPDSFLRIREAQFALFLPEDAHAPMIASGRLHKVVIKMAV